MMETEIERMDFEGGGRRLYILCCKWVAWSHAVLCRVLCGYMNPWLDLQTSEYWLKPRGQKRQTCFEFVPISVKIDLLIPR